VDGLAAPLVVDHGARVKDFYKLTGSGNDFVFFDLGKGRISVTITSGFVSSLCGRGTGVGADGMVCLMRADASTVVIQYWNSDGSTAALCGNAALCTVRLTSLLGMTGERTILTTAGAVTGRLVNDVPEVDLAPVQSLVADQAVTARPSVARRIGYAVAGVPHLVVLVDDVDTVDVAGEGAPLRRDPLLGPEGANVNFVSVTGGPRMRTYERGVEGETLACGTGAVATAALLVAWGLATSPVSIMTRSGSALTVRFTGDRPSLAGEGRLVFTGKLAEQDRE
jgi:diaminopimelate epimerase